MATCWQFGVLLVLWFAPPPQGSLKPQPSGQVKHPAQRRKVTQLNESSNGQTVRVTVGEEVSLTLAENRTTGYHWELAGDIGPALRVVSDKFAADTDRPGSAGTHNWVFHADHAGRAAVELRYRRAWEDAGAAKTLHFDIDVAEQAK